MNKACRILLVLALAACLGRGVAAQPYDRIERRNFWNAGRNINGLRTDSVSISFAQLQGGYESGGLRDSYMAPEGWSAGAEARTIMHLQKLSMKGAFSFVNFSGKDMCGSMSGRPGYYPVDILEFTPGGKTRQTYSFEGGITADLSGRWRLGGEIMFTSENYTKRKDLRHTNYLLDMTVAPSVMYHNGDFAAGLSYIFRKGSETVTAEVLGISSGSYYAFLDKGLMRGVYDIWDSQGTHLSETGVSGFPAKELSHGAALQLQWRSLYAELEYLRSEGSMGEKQNIWFRFPADRFAVRAGWSSGKGPIRHFIRAEAGMEDRRNYESVMESDTQDGVTVTTVYGKNRIMHSRRYSAAPEYEVTAPGWEFRAGARLESSGEQASPVYPYLYFRRIFTGEGYAEALVKIWKFDLGGSIAFRQGTFSDTESLADSGMSAPQEPYYMEEYDSMHMEYITAPRLSAGMSLRFNFWKGLYAEAAGHYAHGFRLRHLDGPDRWEGSLGIGYTF